MSAYTKVPEEVLRLKQALQIFAEMYSEFPLQQIMLFLTVAEEEGITQPDLMKKLGSSQGGVSRNVKKLSHYLISDPEGKGGRVRAGYGLVDQEPDKYDRLSNSVFLTPKGKRMIGELAEIISGVPKKAERKLEDQKEAAVSTEDVVKAFASSRK